MFHVPQKYNIPSSCSPIPTLAFYELLLSSCMTGDHIHYDIWLFQVCLKYNPFSTITLCKKYNYNCAAGLLAYCTRQAMKMNHWLLFYVWPGKCDASEVLKQCHALHCQLAMIQCFVILLKVSFDNQNNFIWFGINVWYISIKLTLNVRGPSYLGLTRSISWLLMPWLLTSPGHQQPWYWLCRIGRFLSYMRKDCNYLRRINVEKWHKM